MEVIRIKEGHANLWGNKGLGPSFNGKCLTPIKPGNCAWLKSMAVTWEIR
jgi:hypothetical protein